MKVNLGGIIALSANEWKDHVSTVIFFAGCPLRCKYCHNQELIYLKNFVEVEPIKEEIRNAIPFIDSVVLTGGEPTMQPEPAEEILRFSKSLGLATMIETSGYYPEVIEEFYIKRLIDHLFIDIKTTEEEYPKITGSVFAYERLQRTLKVPIQHTTRTTIFKNIKLPKCSTFLQRGLLKLSPDKEMEEYTLEEFERLIHNP
jgi:pyruvate formate lyase activating enzyme